MIPSQFFATLKPQELGTNISASLVGQQATFGAGDLFSSSRLYVTNTGVSGYQLYYYTLPDFTLVPVGSSSAVGALGLAVSPNDTYIAFGCSGAPLLKVYNSSTSSFETVTTQPTVGPRGLCFTKDGQYLIVAGTNNTTNPGKAYSTSNFTTAPTTISNWPVTTVYTVDTSPDSTLMAIGTLNSPYMGVFSTSTWDVVSGPTPYGALSRGVSFSSDGQWLAQATTSATRIHTISGWGYSDLTGRSASNSTAAVFSPDSQYLAITYDSANTLIDIYETSGWTKVTTITDTDGVSGEKYLTWSTNMQYLVQTAADSDAPVKVIDAQTWAVTTLISTSNEIPGYTYGAKFANN